MHARVMSSSSSNNSDFSRPDTPSSSFSNEQEHEKNNRTSLHLYRICWSSITICEDSFDRLRIHGRLLFCGHDSNDGKDERTSQHVGGIEAILFKKFNVLNNQINHVDSCVSPAPLVVKMDAMCNLLSDELLSVLSIEQVWVSDSHQGLGLGLFMVEAVDTLFNDFDMSVCRIRFDTSADLHCVNESGLAISLCSKFDNENNTTTPVTNQLNEKEDSECNTAHIPPITNELSAKEENKANYAEASVTDQQSANQEQESNYATAKTSATHQPSSNKQSKAKCATATISATHQPNSNEQNKTNYATAATHRPNSNQLIEPICATSTATTSQQLPKEELETSRATDTTLQDLPKPHKLGIYFGMIGFKKSATEEGVWTRTGLLGRQSNYAGHPVLNVHQHIYNVIRGANRRVFCSAEVDCQASIEKELARPSVDERKNFLYPELVENLNNKNKEICNDDDSEPGAKLARIGSLQIVDNDQHFEEEPVIVPLMAVASVKVPEIVSTIGMEGHCESESRENGHVETGGSQRGGEGSLSDYSQIQSSFSTSATTALAPSSISSCTLLEANSKSINQTYGSSIDGGTGNEGVDAKPITSPFIFDRSRYSIEWTSETCGEDVYTGGLDLNRLDMTGKLMYTTYDKNPCNGNIGDGNVHNKSDGNGHIVFENNVHIDSGGDQAIDIKNQGNLLNEADCPNRGNLLNECSSGHNSDGCSAGMSNCKGQPRGEEVGRIEIVWINTAFVAANGMDVQDLLDESAEMCELASVIDPNDFASLMSVDQVAVHKNHRGHGLGLFMIESADIFFNRKGAKGSICLLKPFPLQYDDRYMQTYTEGFEQHDVDLDIKKIAAHYSKLGFEDKGRGIWARTWSRLEAVNREWSGLLKVMEAESVRHLHSIL